MDADLADLPPPPWSEDLNLGVFHTVEIPRRLITDPLFSDLEPLAFRSMVRLMFFSWHERPPGSLPAHQRTLADAAGFGSDLAGWAAVEPIVMDRWLYASDGRFYLLEWQEAIEAAGARVRKKRSSDGARKRRWRMRAELEGIGLPQVDRIAVDVIDRVIAEFDRRGGAELRGDQRRHALTMTASDLDLLPGAYDADVRLGAPMKKLSTIQTARRG